MQEVLRYNFDLYERHVKQIEKFRSKYFKQAYQQGKSKNQLKDLRGNIEKTIGLFESELRKNDYGFLHVQGNDWQPKLIKEFNDAIADLQTALKITDTNISKKEDSGKPSKNKQPMQVDPFLIDRFNEIKSKFYSDKGGGPSKIQKAAMIELFCNKGYFGNGAKEKGGKNPVAIWQSIAAKYFDEPIMAQLGSSKKSDREQHINQLKKYFK